MREPAKDVYCGFKLWSAAAAEAVFPLQTLEGWTFDAEVLGLARRLGFRVREVGIVWSDRDNSRLSIREVLLPVVRELLAARRNVRRQARGVAADPGPPAPPEPLLAESAARAAETQCELARRGMAVSGFWRALLAIAAGGIAIRVLYTLLEAPWPPPGLDDQFYFSALPKLVADGEGFVNPFLFVLQGGVSLPTAEHPPLHTVVLAGLAELGGTSPDAQRLTGAVFGAGTIVAVGLLARRLAGERAGLVAAAPGGGLPGAGGDRRRADVRVAVRACWSPPRCWPRCAWPRRRAPRAPPCSGRSWRSAALTRSEALLMLPLVVLPLLRTRRGRSAIAVAAVAFARGPRPVDRAHWSAFDQPVAISTNAGSAIARGQLPRDVLRRPARRLAARVPAGAAGAGTRPSTWPGCGARACATRATTPAACRSSWPCAWRGCGACTTRCSCPRGVRRARRSSASPCTALLVALALAGALDPAPPPRRELWNIAVPVVLVAVTAPSTYGNQRFRARRDLARRARRGGPRPALAPGPGGGLECPPP